MSKLKNIEGVCPFCGQANLEYGNHFFNCDNIVFPWKCKCGAEGREVSHIEFLYHENCEKDGTFVAYSK